MKKYLQLRRAKKLLITTHRRYLKVKNRLSPPIRDAIKNHLLELQAALMAKDDKRCQFLKAPLQQLYSEHLKKTGFQQIRDFILGIGVA
ncbi:MAG: hypothetical protein ACRDFB_08020, partial [Rhabdochlamydiaceae bacterium]